MNHKPAPDGATRAVDTPTQDAQPKSVELSASGLRVTKIGHMGLLRAGSAETVWREIREFLEGCIDRRPSHPGMYT